MICTTYFLTFFSELIPPTGLNNISVILQLIQPPKELAPFIRTYWYLKNDTSKEVLQAIVSNGLMSLCFYRSGDLDYAGLGKYKTGFRVSLSTC